MNEIQAALKKKGNIEERVALYEKYGTDAGLKLAFRTRIDQRQIINTLDYHLKRLRWRPDIEKYVVPKVRKRPGPKPRDYVPPPLPDSSNEYDPLYPAIIAEAIRERSKAANNRDKAGRELVALADKAKGEIQRAALVAEQKRLHKIVVQYSLIIDKWKADGILPENHTNGSTLEDDQLAALERKWKYLLKQQTRNRKGIERWTDAIPPNPGKLGKYKEQLKATNLELEKLARILGKERRKPDEGYNRTTTEKAGQSQ